MQRQSISRQSSTRSDAPRNRDHASSASVMTRLRPKITVATPAWPAVHFTSALPEANARLASSIQATARWVASIYRNTAMASISTSASSGSRATPMVERAGAASSPNISI